MENSRRRQEEWSCFSPFSSSATQTSSLLRAGNVAWLVKCVPGMHGSLGSILALHLPSLLSSLLVSFQCDMCPQAQVFGLLVPAAGVALEGCGTFGQWGLTRGSGSLEADLEVL